MSAAPVSAWPTACLPSALRLSPNARSTSQPDGHPSAHRASRRVRVGRRRAGGMFDRAMAVRHSNAHARPPRAGEASSDPVHDFSDPSAESHGCPVSAIRAGGDDIFGGTLRGRRGGRKRPETVASRPDGASSARRSPMMSTRTGHASGWRSHTRISPRAAKEALRSDQSCTACTRREDGPGRQDIRGHRQADQRDGSRHSATAANPVGHAGAAGKALRQDLSPRSPANAEAAVRANGPSHHGPIEVQRGRLLVATGLAFPHWETRP